jgi:hypothetical protein
LDRDVGKSFAFGAYVNSWGMDAQDGIFIASRDANFCDLFDQDPSSSCVLNLEGRIFLVQIRGFIHHDKHVN